MRSISINCLKVVLVAFLIASACTVKAANFVGNPMPPAAVAFVGNPMPPVA